MSKPQPNKITKKGVLAAISKLGEMDKSNEATWEAVKDLLGDISDDNILNDIQTIDSSLLIKTEAEKETRRAVQALLTVVFTAMEVNKSLATNKSLENLIENNHSIGKIELKIDEATTHGRITNQLKSFGVNVDSEQNLDAAAITKIKAFFEQSGKEIQKLFATAKIIPKELHDHIAKHLKNAFDAFQNIGGDPVSSETVKGFIKTLSDVGEAAKAAAGLGNDCSERSNKEALLKKIKEKLPDTPNDLLIQAAAVAFNTTEQVVRFEQSQKEESEKIISAAKARSASDYEEKSGAAADRVQESLVEIDNTIDSREAKAALLASRSEAIMEARLRRASFASGGHAPRLTAKMVSAAETVESRIESARIEEERRKQREEKTTTSEKTPTEYFREEAEESLAQGNLSAAIKNFRKAREARSGSILIETTTEDGVEILFRDARKKDLDPKKGTESFEEEYLKFIMAALDVAEMEGKKELRAALLQKAPIFLQEFLKQANGIGAIKNGTLSQDPPTRKAAEKTLDKLLNKEIKNHLVKSLADAGITNASNKLIVAQTFQDLAISHPDTFAMDPTGEIKKVPTTGKPLEEAEKKALDEIFEQKEPNIVRSSSLRKVVQFFSPDKPDKFHDLPWWHKDLMQKYAPAILASESPLPDSVKTVLGIKSTEKNQESVGQTQRLQMTEPPHPFLATIASLSFVKKLFPNFAKKINERTEEGQKEVNRQPSDRSATSSAFQDVYNKAKGEITPPEKATAVIRIPPEYAAVIEHKAKSEVVAVISEPILPSHSDKPHAATDELAEEAAQRKIRAETLSIAGLDTEQIKKFEKDFFSPISDISDAIGQDLDGTRASLEAARSDISIQAAAETPQQQKTIEQRHSVSMPTMPNEPREAAPSPVGGAREAAPSPVEGEVDKARDEVGKMLSGLGDATRDALAAIRDTTHGVAEVTPGTVESRVAKLEEAATKEPERSGQGRG
jgi:hypothetical protein